VAAANTAKKLAVPHPVKKRKLETSVAKPVPQPKAQKKEEDDSKKTERRKSNLSAEDLLDMCQ